MAASKESHSRLSWLMAAWAEQRYRASQFLGRITDLGPLQAMKPSAVRRFLKFMEQVGEARQEELKIINEIDEIEQQHRFRRMNKQLKKASPAVDKPSAELDPLLDSEGEPVQDGETPKQRWLWFAGLLYLMSSKKINQKSHDLTGD